MSKEVHKEDVVHALREVIDPEMHIDIYTLGLIYNIQVGDGGISILMTLTTPLCPYAADIERAVKDACARFGIPVHVEITFSPAWVAPSNLRAILGI